MILKNSWSERAMFHRTNNGPDLSKNLPEYNEPEQQTFAYQSKVIEQSAVERYARNETVQAAVNSQTANQSQPLTQNQFYVYESPIYEEEKDTRTMTAAADDNKTENKDAPSRIDIPGGVFSRPGQQAPLAGRVPGAYPGAYPGAATYGTPAGATANDPASGRKLYIGQGITL